MTEDASAAGPLAVVVVDNNRDVADSLGLLLQLKGHSVRVFYDGGMALAALEAAPADVVLLDLEMPRLTGLDVARRLRQDVALKGATLVAVSGWGVDPDGRLAAGAGFDHHLTKPPDLDALDAILAGVSRSRPG